MIVYFAVHLFVCLLSLAPLGAAAALLTRSIATEATGEKSIPLRTDYNNEKTTNSVFTMLAATAAYFFLWSPPVLVHLLGAVGGGCEP